MLARLQRSLAFTPSRFARQLSTTPRNTAPQPPVSSLDDEGYLPDSQFITDAPTETPTETLTLSPEPPAKSNGLSYAGLPDHKIFLDLPPAQDPLLRYLTSAFQHDGRRHTAERRASRVLMFLHTLTRAAPLELLRAAIDRVSPSVRIVSHKRAARNIMIPVALREKQQVRYAVKWMLKASESRGGRTVEERLAREIVLVLNGNGGALRQKESLHQTATVNRGNIPMVGRKKK
ncbi:ribosomal protein S7 [Phellopilus nigrolimitatus]|nr:ribosomal protein S7 [Phellopilus nigrolimitatus]